MIVDLGLAFKVLDLGLGGLQTGYAMEMHRAKGFMFKSQLWTGWALEYNVGRMHNLAQARDVMALLEEWAKSAAAKSYTKCPALNQEAHDLTAACLVWKGEITKTNKVRVEYATVPCNVQSSSGGDVSGDDETAGDVPGVDPHHTTTVVTGVTASSLCL